MRVVPLSGTHMDYCIEWWTGYPNFGLLLLVLCLIRLLSKRLGCSGIGNGVRWFRKAFAEGTMMLVKVEVNKTASQL